MSVMLPVVMPIQTVAPVIDHGYLVGAMTVGENGDVITSEDGGTCLKKSDAYILAADGSALSFDDIKAGDVITYLVDPKVPQTLQLPVTYSPAVIVVGADAAEVTCKIAVFDEDGLSDDGELIINYDLSTPYYSRTREATLISGKALVLYNMMTMSIPAQTNPLAIVKLVDDEKLVVVSAPDTQAPDLSGVKTIVAGENTLAHIPVTVNGVQMLPVRAVAEALGYEVEWVGETKSVNVGFASFSIEEDSYSFARRAPQSLGQAPVLIALPTEQYATTYVPASFFTEVLDHRMTLEGDTLVISSNDEPMFIPPLTPGEFQVPVDGDPVALPIQPGEFEVPVE